LCIGCFGAFFFVASSYPLTVSNFVPATHSPSLRYTVGRYATRFPECGSIICKDHLSHHLPTGQWESICMGAVARNRKLKSSIELKKRRRRSCAIYFSLWTTGVLNGSLGTIEGAVVLRFCRSQPTNLVLVIIERLKRYAHTVRSKVLTYKI